MKFFFKKIAWLGLVLILVLSTLDASWAARLGGGRSVGRQSSYVSQRYQTPPRQAPSNNNLQAPAPSRQNTAAPATPAPGNVTAPAPRRQWGGILGGVAAGLGLAWLANSIGGGGGGMASGFGTLLTLAFVGILVAVAIRFFFGKKNQTPSSSVRHPTWPGDNVVGTEPTPETIPTYRPENLGNDASARPWERASELTPSTAAASSVLAGNQTWGIPAGFDVSGFLASCKTNYPLLQEAWDAGNVDTLRMLMSDSLWQETKTELAQRQKDHPGVVQQTEVAELDAKLLGIEELKDIPNYMASVEFSGQVKETADGPFVPFKEVWNLTKPKEGHGAWLLAGIQAVE